jgi:hypothetical protein
MNYKEIAESFYEMFAKHEAVVSDKKFLHTRRRVNKKRSRQSLRKSIRYAHRVHIECDTCTYNCRLCMHLFNTEDHYDTCRYCESVRAERCGSCEKADKQYQI